MKGVISSEGEGDSDKKKELRVCKHLSGSGSESVKRIGGGGR